MVIAIQECSNGNETVGDMWVETMVFDKSEPVEKVVEWGARIGRGRLLLSKPQNSGTMVVQQLQFASPTNSDYKSASQIADLVEKRCFPEKGQFVHLNESEVRDIVRQLRIIA